MKKHLVLVALGVLLTATTPAFATTLSSSLPISSANTSSAISFLEMDDVLPGEKSERTYTYTVLTDEEPGKNKVLSIDWTHSELLIPPSALTIKIDGEPIKSTALSEATTEGNVTIPLNTSQLTKGTHEVKLAYTGIVKGRLCDEGDTSGSWLTIHPSSFVGLSESTASLSLEDYPHPFVQTYNDPLTIVLPQQANTEELEAGLLLYRELKRDAQDGNNVSLQYDQAIDTLKGRYIFVGETDSFSGEVAQWIEQLNPDLQKDDVLFERVTLKNQSDQTDALFVLAQNGEAFEGTLDYLLDEQQRVQLNGERLVLSSAPTPRPNQTNITLKTLGAKNLYLSGSEPASARYYQALPMLDENATVKIELKYKVAGELISNNENDVRPELTALINEVPYSIPLQQSTDEEAWLTHTIDVDSTTLGRNPSFDFSFEATGLRSETSCTSTDADRWVFISDESQILIPPASNEKHNETFQNLTSIFEADEGVVIVTDPQLNQLGLQNLGNIMEGLSIPPSTKKIDFVSADAFSKDMVEERSILIVGNPESYPFMKERQSDWVISNKGEVDLTTFGFIPETTEQIAWIQPSLWNKDEALIVISPNDQPVDSSLMQSLIAPKETFNIAVQNQNGSVFTNSAYFEKNTSGVSNLPESAEDNQSIWYMVGFAALVVVILSILYLQRRKKHHS